MSIPTALPLTSPIDKVQGARAGGFWRSCRRWRKAGVGQLFGGESSAADIRLHSPFYWFAAYPYDGKRLKVIPRHPLANDEIQLFDTTRASKPSVGTP